MPGIAQLYLHSTELTIREYFLVKPKAHDPTGFLRFQRLQQLESILTSIERWRALFSELPLADWTGITVDSFNQFMHCVVVLFKLTTLDEPGWDLEEVRRRADVFEVLDRTCEKIERVPAMLGMVDADGPRNGLFFKTGYLLRAIKALFLEEMTPEKASSAAQTPYPGQGGGGTDGYVGDDSIPVDFLMGLADEPWLMDIFPLAPEFGADAYLSEPTAPFL